MRKTVFLICCLFHGILQAQRVPVAITRINEPVTFDGIINEPFWETASNFPLIRQSPDYGTEPSEKTDVRMVYDNNYLYVASKLYHKDVSKIQDYSKKRDGGGPMDYMTFILDGYSDKTNGLVFATTPAGLRWDGAVTFGSKGLSLTSDWNTYWEVKTSRDSRGWYAEFKVPLSSLRFNSAQEDVLMNLVVYRKIASKNEFSVFPDIPPNWGLLSFANIAEGYPILFKGIKNSNPIYVTPYALGGLSGNQVINEAKTDYQNSSGSNLQAGLDVKYSLSSKLTLDATVNTDFAQVEADNFQVNLMRSSLFFPEKREFFLERTNNFSFGFDLNNDVFYSRKIGLENGELSRIYGGARLVGRIKKWDIAFLNMQTEDKSTSASKNIGLVRLKKQIGSGNGYFGGIMTSSIGKNGNEFYVYGLDGQFVLPLKSYLKIAAVKSSGGTLSTDFSSFNNVRLNAKLEMPSQVGFYYYLSHSIVGKDYNPVIGFEERANLRSYDAGVGYALFPKRTKSIFKHIFNASAYQIDGFASNQKETAGIEFGYYVELKNGASLKVKKYFQEEILTSPLIFSKEVAIPIGAYDFQGIKTTISTPTGTKFNVNASLDLGSFYNGNIISLTPQARWDGSKLLQLQANYRYDKINFGENKPSFENHLLSLSSLFTFTTKFSISGLGQYDYLNSKIGSNIRLRYNTKEGNDLFVVLTNINNTDRFRELPHLPTYQSWLLVVKYKHTFAF
jgi:Domain of unknown function (DUF5916)